MAEFGIMAIHPVFGLDAARDPGIAVAAARCGGIGIYDVEFLNIEQIVTGTGRLVKQSGGGRCGIRCGVEQVGVLESVLDQFANATAANNVVVLCAGKHSFTSDTLKKTISHLHSKKLSVFCEVICLEEGKLAAACGADVLILKGNEAGGRVGEETSPILLQRCKNELSIPIWLQGGIGLHTAAAAIVGGASGVVLDAQLLLLRESPLGPLDRDFVARLDGTETVCVQVSGKEQYRLRNRSGATEIGALQSKLDSNCVPDQNQAACATTNRSIVYDALQESFICASSVPELLPLGQDAAFSAKFAEKYLCVAGVMSALRDAVKDHCINAAKFASFSPSAPLAVDNGTQYPILQGAMTRVSDTAEFAKSVADNGALPFLALALMRGEEVEQLLQATAKVLGDKPWGVGILGFVPHQLRQEQTAVIEKYRPPFALIAGGRPDQSADLEKLNIKTYLHVPSPLLLDSFIEAGCRRFIFEGRECGGHVGPRSSFVLWEQMIDVLLEAVKKSNNGKAFHVVFAGGIHDDISAAMVAALSAPLAAAEVRLGLLMGTAYLFTEEAVQTGAICNKFQDAALACTDTVLFETGPGHSIRCLTSPYKDTFDQTRRQLEQSGIGKNEVRQELELMNLGRLRTASKGLARPENGSGLVTVSEDKQWKDGMYMIGQVAALHQTRMSMRDLHETVCRKGSEILKRVAPGETITVNDDTTGGGGEPIAIVGMSCLFPKANNLEEFWQNILQKVDTIEEVPGYQWDASKLYSPDPLARDKIYSRWGGFLQDIPFDPSIYGIPPASLASIDPLQMLILEVTRAALADAGFSTRGFNKERTSVFLANAGHGPITAFYSLRSMLDWTLADMPAEYRSIVEKRLPEWTEDSFPGYLGNVIAGRVANRFDLGGVNFCIDAACASSLAALHAAVRELRAGTSECVLLASTDTHNQPGDYLSFSKTHALSPRGRCRTFDATADGIVISEGLAVLVLKRLRDAERDGDRIYAVIRGIGGSSDGRDLSLTAPRPAGQMLALRRAYEDAGVSPSSVELVEAHGTGTVAGDRAEVEALTKVFAEAGAAEQSCAIGSVKTMIGHTKCSAGLASMIKVAKSLYHKVLPPTLGVETPNPACKFGSSPFYVNSETRPWIHPDRETGSPRRAGVSAFGFGGTNFHAIMEEYTGFEGRVQESAYRDLPAELFVFKTPSREALSKAVSALEVSVNAAIKAQVRPHGPMPDSSRLTLAELSYRHFVKAHSHTRASNVVLGIVAQSLEDLAGKLQQVKQLLADSARKTLRDPRGIYLGELDSTGNAPRVAFLFPGQGAQQTNMLRDLSLVFKEVRQSFETADTVLEGKLPRKLSSYVFPPPAFSEEERKARQASLTDTRIAQPAVGAAGLAAYKLLKDFGLKPELMAGHSFGEYIALCAAGAISEAELYSIAEKRGDILGRADGVTKGSMGAVSASEEQLNKLLPLLPGITLANINSPVQCIISGATADVESAIVKLNELGLKARPIPVSAAFHSPLMEPARNDLFAALKLIEFKTPNVVVYSNTTADAYPTETSSIADLLARHVVEPVRFQQEIKNMHEAGVQVFVECGPGTILTGLVNDTLGDRPHLAVSIDRNGRNGVVQFMHALALLSVAGVEVNTQRLYAHRFDGRTIATSSESTVSGGRKRLFYLVNSAQIRRFDPETGHIHPAPVRTPNENEIEERTKIKIRPTPGSHSAANPIQPNVSQAPIAKTPTSAVNSTQRSQGEISAAENSTAGNMHDIRRPASGQSNSLTPPATSGQTAKSNNPASGQTNVSKNGTAYPVMASGTNGSYPVARGASGRSNNVGPQVHDGRSAGRSVNQTPPTSGLTERDRVLVEFQQTMLEMTSNFLGTQERVMLAYLGAPEISTPSVPRQPVARATNHAPSTEYLYVNGNGNGNGNNNGNGHDNGNGNGRGNTHPYANQGNVSSVQSKKNGSREQIDQDIRAIAKPHASPEVSSNQKNIAHKLEPRTAAQPDAAKPQTNNASELNADFLIGSLINIVSERTGYPTEMLDPELDLEADLGIDSIKRVEILNNFRKLLPEERQHNLEDGIERLAGTKTLQGIMDWIRNDLVAGHATSEPTGKPPANTTPERDRQASRESVPPHIVPTPAKTSYVARAVLKTVELQPLTEVNLPSDHLYLIAGPPTELASAVQHNLSQRGLKVLRLVDRPKGNLQESGVIKTISGSVGEDAVECDLNDLNESKSVLVKAIAAEPRVALIFVADPAAAPSTHSETSEQERARRSVYSLFALSKCLHAVLPHNTAWRWLAVINADGTYGVEKPFEQPLLAGVSGLAKTVAREWSHVKARVVNFAETETLEAQARLIELELSATDEPVEIGYRAGQRFGIDVTPAPLHPNGGDPEKVQLDSSSVVLVTGGARGITADLVHSLARDYKPTLVILGRGQRPAQSDPAWAKGLTAVSELKSAIMQQLKQSGKPVNVPAVESIYRELVRDREIRENLERLEKTGSRVHYHALDVRDADSFGRLIDRLYDTLGRIDAVIHGAGVIEDAFIKDKSVESFDRVFRTKVDSALVLSRKLQLQSLKYLVLFSSVVGRTGNAGQADYVAANEVLNKLAGNLQQRCAGRVVSVGWGPWRAGMARPEMESMFAKYGWAMIEVSDGVASFRQELSYGKQVEVLLVGKPIAPGEAPQSDAVTTQVTTRSSAVASPQRSSTDSEQVIRSLVKAAAPKKPQLRGARINAGTVTHSSEHSLHVSLTLDPAVDVYLEDHAINGVPVLPMAVAAELLAELATALKPEWHLVRLEQIEVPCGITFADGKQDVLLKAIEHEQKTDEVVLNLTLSLAKNPNRVSYKCRAVMSDHARTNLTNSKFPSKYHGPDTQVEVVEPMLPPPTVEQVYRNWMFHGRTFQGIDSVRAMGKELVLTGIETVAVSDCLKVAGNAAWALDPVLLDSAMQSGGIWSRQYLGITALPTGIGALWIVNPLKGKHYSVMVKIPPGLTGNELICDLAVYDSEGTMVLMLEGLTGVGHKELNRLAENQVHKPLRSGILANRQE